MGFWKKIGYFQYLFYIIWVIFKPTRHPPDTRGNFKYFKQDFCCFCMQSVSVFSENNCLEERKYCISLLLADAIGTGWKIVFYFNMTRFLNNIMKLAEIIASCGWMWSNRRSDGVFTTKDLSSDHISDSSEWINCTWFWQTL